MESDAQELDQCSLRSLQMTSCIICHRETIKKKLTILVTLKTVSYSSGLAAAWKVRGPSTSKEIRINIGIFYNKAGNIPVYLKLQSQH